MRMIAEDAMTRFVMTELIPGVLLGGCIGGLLGAAIDIRRAHKIRKELEKRVLNATSKEERDKAGKELMEFNRFIHKYGY